MEVGSSFWRKLWYFRLSKDKQMMDSGWRDCSGVSVVMDL